MPRIPKVVSILLVSLIATTSALAADLSSEDLYALLHSAGGRFILGELGMTVEAMDTAGLGENASVSRKLKALAQGMDEIRGRYLGEHPNEGPLFEDSREIVSESQRARIRTLLHREGTQSIDFVRVADEIRTYSAMRTDFLAAPVGDSEIPAGMTPVTDQGDTLQCWAVTATARADLDAGFRLSARYTVYIKTKIEVIDLILGAQFKMYLGQLTEGGPFKNIYYEQGGVFADAVEAFKVGGTMPEAAYPGFPKKDEGLFDNLNDVISDYANRARHGQIDFDDPAVRAEVEQKVTGVLNRRWGKPPESFDYNGQSYDPKSFLNRYLPSWRNLEALELNFAPGNHDGPDVIKAFDGTPYRSYETANHRALMRVLEESLRAGYKPVLQYKVVNEPKTQHAGEIGFEVHGLTKPANINWNDKEILDHYVLAIQGEWDEAGNLKRLLIKNTWDTSPTAKFGFHWIEADYFSLFEAVEIHPDLEARFRFEGLVP